jgi:hypothetical protein
LKNALFSFFVPLLLLATFIMPQPAPAQTVSDTKTVVQSADSVTDAALETAYSEAIGGDDAGYHFRRNGSGYTAYNAAHDLIMDATPETVTFSFSDETWQLVSDIPAAEITIHENRLTIKRDGYEEWYVNGPMGIQQGFTLHEPTNISFDLGGTLATTASRQTLHLGDKLTFAGLIAYDASGQTVPVEFKVEDNRLVYAYDDNGAAYPITIDPWLQQAKLLASDGEAGDLFGGPVALDGDTALVGARRSRDNDLYTGSAYVFVRNGTTWTQQAKLMANDAADNDWFGSSLALDGDTALVGAFGDDNQKGSAYVFVRSGTTWTQQAKLLASDGAEFDLFGRSVALDGETALIGAPLDDDLGLSSGSAYVFVRSGTAWTQQAKLTGNVLGAYGFFGNTVALDGDTALVGSHGHESAYVFVRSGSTWTYQAKLLHPNPGQYIQYFGTSVELDGDTALILSAYDGTYEANHGGISVFVRSGITWTYQTHLNTHGDMALDGNIALITGVESVYVLVRSGTTWTQQAVLSASDGEAGDRFGAPVALDGGTALIGAVGDDDNGEDSGSAYVFTLDMVPLTASAACNGPNLDVTISAGDGSFDITASAGINTPITGVSSGMTVINGPEKWDDLTVTETNGDFESINLGQFKCRTDERPVPTSPAHRSRITDPFPLFSWTGISNANNYRVFLFDDASAATRTVDIRQNSGGPTSMTLNTALPDGRLFWRVRGRQNRVWSLWSIRFTLFKDPVVPLSGTTPMPTLELAPPNSPPTDIPLPTPAPRDDPTLPTQVPLPTTAPGDDPTLPAPPNTR